MYNYFHGEMLYSNVKHALRRVSGLKHDTLFSSLMEIILKEQIETERMIQTLCPVKASVILQQWLLCAAVSVISDQCAFNVY